MASVLCLGMCALDAIYRVESIPAMPTKILASDYTESGGGMAASASVAVARLGGKAAYWGRAGNDALGDRIVAELADEGVDVSDVRRIRGAVSPSAAILVADNGERLVCAYNDPALDTDASWLPLARVPQYDAVLVDVRWPAGSSDVLDAARNAGRFAVLDADIAAADVLADLSQRATHTVYSEIGLAQASGTADPGSGLRRVTAAGRFVGVTLGAAGFLWLDGASERREPAPAIRALDTLAAGDVWHGAFTLALAEDRDIAGAARFANVAAAIKCTRFGGRRGCPSRREVDQALRAY